MKRRSVSLHKALSDPRLLGGALAGDSWRPWRILLIAAAGEPLSARLATRIGIDRRPRDVSPTLDQYLHAKRQGADRIGEAAE